MEYCATSFAEPLQRVFEGTSDGPGGDVDRDRVEEHHQKGGIPVSVTPSTEARPPTRDR